MRTVHYCPFCGDEDLWPESGHSTWRCRSCTRAFTVRTVTPQEQQ